MDVPRLRSLLARAFEHDPMFGWMFPDARTRQHAVAAFFGLLVEFYAEHGRVELVEESRNPVGVALWRVVSRGKARPDSKTLPTVGGFLAAVVGPEHAATVGAGLAGIGDLIPPDEPYVYLNVLGVEPTFHGKGLGLSAITRVTDAAAEQRLPVHLETTNPHNVDWYDRRGFVVSGTMRLGGEGPMLWAMTRRPR